MRRIASLANRYAFSCRSVMDDMPHRVEFVGRPTLPVERRALFREAMIDSFLISMAKKKNQPARRMLQPAHRESHEEF